MDEIKNGIERAILLQNSKVNNVFTPHTPIKSHHNLVGRAGLATKLIECLIKPGHHSLLFGERGVGKSSLANAVCDLILKKLYTGDIIKKCCDSTDSFSSLMEEPLSMAGVNIHLHQSSREAEAHAEVSSKSTTGIIEASGKAGGKVKAGNVYQYDHNTASPAWIGRKIKDLRCLIVIDEFDAIADDHDKYKMAELLKYLSDNSDTVNVMIVGIGESAEDLTTGHPSVGRCLMEVQVDRMDDLELRKIIIDGAQKLGLIFQDEVVNKIVSVSAGYPYFTHLISLKCAEEAIVAKRKHISIENLNEALSLAVDSAKSTIGSAYFSAIRGNRSAERKNVLLAAANCSRSEFSVRDIARELSKLLGVDVEPKSFTRFMQASTSDNNDKIFRRIRQSVYQFSDPRMPSFIHMAASI